MVTTKTLLLFPFKFITYMAESDCLMIVFVGRWGMEKPFSYVMLFCTLPLFLYDETRAILISLPLHHG